MTEFAKRYGGSLYELAAEERLDEQILQELDTVVAGFQAEPGYLRLLSAPNLPKQERRALLDEAFAGAHPYTVNFLKVLCDEGALRELPGCARAYRDLYNAAHGILEVTAAAAVDLDAAARAKLTKALETRTGKTVRLTVKVEPGLLGGIRLDMGGVQLDGTVRHRLEALKSQLAAATL